MLITTLNKYLEEFIAKNNIKCSIWDRNGIPSYWKEWCVISFPLMLYHDGKKYHKIDFSDPMLISKLERALLNVDFDIN